jgi:hypothetical protein
MSSNVIGIAMGDAMMILKRIGVGSVDTSRCPATSSDHFAVECNGDWSPSTAIVPGSGNCGSKRCHAESTCVRYLPLQLDLRPPR